MRLGKQLSGGPGRGVRYGLTLSTVCHFDDETFEEVRNRALREGTSLSQAIRELVELGLETEKEDTK